MENQININNSLDIYALASTAEGIQWLKQRTALFGAPTNLTLNDDGLVQIRYDNDIVGEVPPWIMAENANRMRLSLGLSKAKFAAKFNVTTSSQISFLFGAANFFDSANAVPADQFRTIFVVPNRIRQHALNPMVSSCSRRPPPNKLSTSLILIALGNRIISIAMK